MSARLISVIGPPAVGKTTLAELLAADLPAELIREDYAGNPFLAESYVGTTTARLPSQLYFLLSRVGQLGPWAWPVEGLLISDYGYCQDRIFAATRLSRERMRLYDRLAEELDPLVRRPDLLICLDAAVETLQRRIAERGRGFEEAMTEEFLSAMRVSYHRAVAGAACEVIRLDCDSLDLRRPDARAALVGEIRGLMEPS